MSVTLDLLWYLFGGSRGDVEVSSQEAGDTVGFVTNVMYMLAPGFRVHPRYLADVTYSRV
jgi:hypothetical protein